MAEKTDRNIYANVSCLDYRYYDIQLAAFLSEDAFTAYKCKIELALVQAMSRRGLCPESIVPEVKAACEAVTTSEVYAEEDRIKHDIRALVNCIRAKVSDEAKPYVHMMATSYDIVDTANAARFKDATIHIIVPRLKDLARELITIVLREADTLQVGRTHGQHAVPITFGFAMAEYLDRLGNSIEQVEVLAGDLRGKMSGAVGAYNASSLFVKDPTGFEADVLKELELRPGNHSTQIVQPEPMLRLMQEVTIAGGIMANLCRDLRNLQRTEIGEVGEEFGADQVGSSTMPQKRNPINLENGEGMWKVLMPRIITAYMDQISDHQRDLTNSVTARTYGETFVYLGLMAKRLTSTLKKLRVDKGNLEKNFGMQKGLIAAEPLYLILASLGHPDAHEAVRGLTLKAQATNQPLTDVLFHPSENALAPYIEQMTPHQIEILRDPSTYTGLAATQARHIADYWFRQLEYVQE